MRILAVISNVYGERMVSNIVTNGPKNWTVETWQAPVFFPLVIDYPEDFLPETLPPTDLILSFAEHKGVAELLPEIAQMTGAQAVIAGVDNEAWLPRGLARQLHGWLHQIGVACATPKPLCSLTEVDYLITRRERGTVTHPLIREFARYFGRPELSLKIDPESKCIISAHVRRDSVCGCTRYVAGKLEGVHADEAEEQAGLLHHHYPCLASMGIDVDFSDTLMHVSGNILRENVLEQVKPYKTRQYIVPND